MEGSVIDARFHRAVDIVQSLPKGGPVQTSYEEKLYLYALYKQATEGDISIARPGMLDLLGRSKWDSWNKQKGKGKEAAKRDYISALLRILKKHHDHPICSAHISELEPHPTHRSRSRTARSTSSSSSSSSYHSSQAPSPPQYTSFPPPDPTLPVPDVAPDIIPPSALNSSHKSLLSLGRDRSPPTDQIHRGGSEAGYSYTATRGGVLPYNVPGQGSRAHSLIVGRTGSVDVPQPYGRKDSVHSFRRHPGGPAAALGFVPGIAGPSGTQPGYNSNLYPSTPQVFSRDYTHTPGLTATGTPYLDIQHPTPTYPPNPNRRIGTPSTYSAPPINVPATLQQIQTSLIAINERMNHLERSQAMILRRDERKRTWFWSSRDEDDLDEAEDEQERERMRGAEVRTGTIGKKGKKRWSLRLIWWLLSLGRRLMVDLGVGLLVGIAAMVIVRGWRGEVGRRVRLRLRGLLEAA